MSEASAFITHFRESTGRLPSHVEVSKKLGLSPQKAVEELIAYTREPAHDEEITTARRAGRDFLIIGLFIVAGITFILSIYFTALWFSSMFNLFIAGAISVAMVAYMVLSPQMASRVKGIVKLPLWGSFAIALIFSMGSTVAGQYNQLTANVDVESATERATLDLLRTQESDLVASIAVDREQQASHQKTLEQLSATAEDRIANYAYIATERNKVAELAASIAEKESKLSSLRSSIFEQLQQGNVGVVEERQDFYGWLATLFGLTRAQMEFLISALPAVFIDIIATLSLNLALRKV